MANDVPKKRSGRYEYRPLWVPAWQGAAEISPAADLKGGLSDTQARNRVSNQGPCRSGAVGVSRWTRVRPYAEPSPINT